MKGHSLWVWILRPAGPFLQHFKLMQHNILTKPPVLTVKEWGEGGTIFLDLGAELKEFLSSPLFGDEIIDKMEKMRRVTWHLPSPSSKSGDAFFWTGQKEWCLSPCPMAQRRLNSSPNQLSVHETVLSIPRTRRREAFSIVSRWRCRCGKSN